MAWLQRRTHAIKESWERILLEELFVFSGGSEGTWLTVAGWIPSKDTRQRTNDRAGVLLEDGRVSLSSNKVILRIQKGKKNVASNSFPSLLLLLGIVLLHRVLCKI